MNRRKVLVGGGAVLTSALAGCSESSSSDREEGDTSNNGSNDNNESDTGSGDGDTSEETQVELLDHEWYNDGQFSAGVKGQVENVSGDTLSYVEVEVYFLDSDGVQFSESLDNTSDLAADRVWEFDAMFTGEDASRVENYEIETSVSNY